MYFDSGPSDNGIMWEGIKCMEQLVKWIPPVRIETMVYDNLSDIGH